MGISDTTQPRRPTLAVSLTIWKVFWVELNLCAGSLVPASVLHHSSRSRVSLLLFVRLPFLRLPKNCYWVRL
jgi:hypothetical protein